MTLRTPSARLLRRTAAAAVLVGDLSMVSAPAALAAGPADSSSAEVSQNSDQGWTTDVRADSADSTKAVAGIAVLVVAGFTTAVTVRPHRRPPAEG
jgi:hypothetical protein